MQDRTQIRCDKCGVAVGELLHTGDFEKGIPKVRTELFDNCIEIPVGLAMHYRCRDCFKEGEKAK